MTSELLTRLDRLRQFQERHELPVSDISRQSPQRALHSLRDATKKAPKSYRDYLNEAVDCYEANAYRASVLMVWAASVAHIYHVIENKQNGFKELESANAARFGKSNKYKKIKKRNDLLYIGEKELLLICEDAGVFNRNARSLLEEKLNTRNRCAHPTEYKIGRDEAVVFIESLILNVVNGAMMQW